MQNDGKGFFICLSDAIFIAYWDHISTVFGLSTRFLQHIYYAKMGK